MSENDTEPVRSRYAREIDLLFEELEKDLMDGADNRPIHPIFLGYVFGGIRQKIGQILGVSSDKNDETAERW